MKVGELKRLLKNVDDHLDVGIDVTTEVATQNGGRIRYVEHHRVADATLKTHSSEDKTGRRTQHYFALQDYVG